MGGGLDGWLWAQVPVPRALCLCEDATILGAPFYVMSFVAGRVFDDPALPELAPEQVSCTGFRACGSGP